MAAAANRKLQKEIENTLKKVEDGLVEFEDYWDQALSSSGAQREKLGEELKKSINKLQRLRAQIREWLAHGGVPSASKDKLEDARKKIESDMQRFKDFERDLKTKAFSTCALTRGGDNGEDDEKCQHQDWLSSTIQQLNDQRDLFDADIEILSNRKSLSSDDKSRLAELKTLQERHGWHIKKLELLLRATDNDAVNLSELEGVRESVDYYVENHEDNDYYHDEELYAAFDLAEYEVNDDHGKSKAPAEGVSLECNTPSSSKEEPNKKAKEKDKRRKDDKKEKGKKEVEKKAAPAQPVATKTTSGRSVKAANDENREPEEVKVQEDQLMSEAEEFICKICQIHVVGCSPKLTSCSHLFCGDCIAQWFAQHPEVQTWAQRARSAGPERVVPCPVCKQPLNEKNDLYPVCGVTSRSENLLLWRMLSSLKIMCANHPKVKKDGKCLWVGEYGSYQKHAKVCDNTPGPEGGYPASETKTQASTAPPASVRNDEAAGPPRSSAITQAAAAMAAASAPTESEAASSAAPSRDASVQGTPAAPGAPAAAPQAVRELPLPAAAVAPQPAPSNSPSLQPAPQQPPSNVGATAASATKEQPPPAKSAGPAAAVPAPRVAAPTVAPSAAAAPATPAVPPAAASSQPAAPAPQQAPKPAPQPAPRQPAAVAAPRVEESHVSLQAHKAAAETHAAPAPEEENVVIASSEFLDTSTEMVGVRIGDRIQVLDQHPSGWTYARNLTLAARDASKKSDGWVPSWVTQSPEPTAPQAKAKALAAQQEQAAAAKAAQQARLEQQVREAAAAAEAQARQQQAAAQARAQAQAAAEAQRQQALQAEQAAQRQAAAMQREQRLMRVTTSFSATSGTQLTLSQGEYVEIVERHPTGWTYGKKAMDDGHHIEGWFPDWAVVNSHR
eukprot:TRINITY_DN7903_c0_g1_i2.p1 TRINITY_DN7903_c0_g1~~TRINITY_DN7903_c0_g1_i2.p1  ORF type:complete len:900 (+),score=259.20 TRINITY_DN7903_c0_g1_i2:157-2856(+)